MLRTRSLERWQPSTQYYSPEAFLASRTIPNGSQEVHLGEQTLDLLVRDSGSDATLVVFHASLSSRIASVPAFSGIGIAKRSGMNLVAVSDPSIGMGDIDLAWFLGNTETGPLRPVLAPLVRHAVELLASKRVVLMGASGGGFAAVHFGEFFPNATVLAINPRLNLSGGESSDFGRYLELCHGGAPEPGFFPLDLGDYYSRGLPFDLALYQNTGDPRFRDHHSGPFVRRLHQDRRLVVREQYDGDGHLHIPAETLQEILRGLSEGSPLGELGFTPNTESSLASLG